MAQCEEMPAPTGSAASSSPSRFPTTARPTTRRPRASRRPSPARPVGAPSPTSSPSSPPRSRACSGGVHDDGDGAHSGASAASGTLYFTLFYLWCAVATMGKGPRASSSPPPSPGLPHHLGPVALLPPRARCSPLDRLPGRRDAWCPRSSGAWAAVLRPLRRPTSSTAPWWACTATPSIRYFMAAARVRDVPVDGLVPVALLGWRQVVPATRREQRAVATVGAVWFLSRSRSSAR